MPYANKRLCLEFNVHFPQMKTTLSKFIELLILGTGTRLATAGLGRRRCGRRERGENSGRRTFEQLFYSNLSVDENQFFKVSSFVLTSSYSFYLFLFGFLPH